MNKILRKTKKFSNFFLRRHFATTTAAATNVTEAKEIFIRADNLNHYYPTKSLPQFKDGVYTLFEYKEEPANFDDVGEYHRLPQVPYEIKEHGLKSVLYGSFLVWIGRFLTSFNPNFFSGLAIGSFSYIPAAVVSYHILRPLWYMYNAITTIRLKEDGSTVIFEFKNGLQKPLEIEVQQLKKKKNENFFAECYTEPYLFPIEVDFTGKYGKFSLKNKRTYYIYGDSFNCIKDGELFRAVLNSQPIKLK